MAAPVATRPSAARAQTLTAHPHCARSAPRGSAVASVRSQARSLLQGTGGLASARVSILKARLRNDLTAAMKSRDELVRSTLRMTLTAVHNAEVAGTQARELDDDEVLQVIRRESKKRAESAEAF